jgi:cytochrome c oxidase subunit 3
MTLAAQFENAAQRSHAAKLGMWVFVGSESMFFAALFGLYAALRAAHPAGFARGAAGSELAIGTANTVILLTSSLMVVLAVDSVRHGRNGRARAFLGATIALGLGFLALKSIEYGRHLNEGIGPGYGAASDGEQDYFTLYYGMTGLHALHVVIGLGVLAWLFARVHSFRSDEHGHGALELGAIYWHFVDLVWLYLWPLFYLIR